jgi:putative transcriptional regulator
MLNIGLRVGLLLRGSLPFNLYKCIILDSIIQMCNIADMGKARINRIKEVLKEHGRSQYWLSESAKITYASVNMYCNGKREPSLETLEKVAKALKVDICDLINE